MKDNQIKIQIEQLAIAIKTEINIENDTDRNCRLQDAAEHLRRAWHCVDDSKCENNDLILS